MKKLLVSLIVLVIVSSVGADVITVDTIGDFFVDQYDSMRTIGTLEGFTLDGVPADDVYALVISYDEVGDYSYLNGYGYSTNDGVTFAFNMFDQLDTVFAPASNIVFIIEAGDGDLFEVVGGNLYIGIGGDQLLMETNVSIDGKSFGDISDIHFDRASPSFVYLDTVALVTPEPATMLLLGLGGLVIIRRKS